MIHIRAFLFIVKSICGLQRRCLTQRVKDVEGSIRFMNNNFTLQQEQEGMAFDVWP